MEQNEPYNNNNKTSDIKEKNELTTKEKNNPSNKPKYLNISRDVPSVNSASKKTLNSNANTKFSENPYLENLYSKLLMLAQKRRQRNYFGYLWTDIKLIEKLYRNKL